MVVEKGILLKLRALETNDDLLIRKGRQYCVFTEKVGNKEFKYIVNDSSIRIPYKDLGRYIDAKVLVEDK